MTSATWSPAAGRPVALGYVHRDFTAEGTTVQAGGLTASVALQFFGISQQKHQHILPRVVELAGGHKAISAIVALPTNDTDLFRLGIMLEHKLGHGCASFFHEGERRNSIFFSGDAVDLEHLSGGNNFHECCTLLEAMASSRAMFPGSPITIR